MKKSVVLPWDQYQRLMQQNPHEDEEEEENAIYTHDCIIATVPQKSKSRARALLDLLTQTDIAWNNYGECVLKGQSIQGSNICDLVKCLLFNYKSFQPNGYHEFIHSLANFNIPETLIVNAKCRNDIQQLKCKPKGDLKPWLTL